jgi:hypothetical protein
VSDAEWEVALLDRQVGPNFGHEFAGDFASAIDQTKEACDGNAPSSRARPIDRELVELTALVTHLGPCLVRPVAARMPSPLTQIIAEIVAIGVLKVRCW